MIFNYFASSQDELFLFSRSPDKADVFLKIFSFTHHNYPLDDFGKHHYDVIINCIGAGTPERVTEQGYAIFSLTKAYDERILQYLQNKPETTYIYLSSGVVHNPLLNQYPVPTNPYSLNINNVTGKDVYAVTKLCAEKNHRRFQELKIVDIRVFSYFSRFIDLSSGFLITSVLRAVMDKKKLFTNSGNIIRDYLHPADLFSLIECCAVRFPGNTALDAFSSSPVSKFDLLDRFHQDYNLHYEIVDNLKISNPTGDKDVFSPLDFSAENIGYSPAYSSLVGIMAETKEFMNDPRLNPATWH